MSALELKIPPPFVALIAGTLMWLVSPLANFAAFHVLGQTQIAACLALAGFGMIVMGIFCLRRARTTVNPIKPSSASTLLVSGMYKYSRNPMYVGLIFLLLGWATHLSNGLAFAFIPLFVMYMNRFQITPEERALTLIFGAEYAAYKASVKRWL
jgi:protein-S-isoprenylcysteine O-methyltransferase Ste14